MKNIFKYLKEISFFLIIEVFISIIISILNVIGFNYYLSKLFIFIINIILFSYIGYQKGNKSNKKGIYTGILSGTMYIIPLIFISLIFFIKDFSIYSLLYYLTLILFCTITSIIGKNKSTNTKQ